MPKNIINNSEIKNIPISIIPLLRLIKPTTANTTMPIWPRKEYLPESFAGKNVLAVLAIPGKSGPKLKGSSLNVKVFMASRKLVIGVWPRS